MIQCQTECLLLRATKMVVRLRPSLQQLRHSVWPRQRYSSSSNNNSNSSNRGTSSSDYKENGNESSAYKLGAIVVFVFGLSYASVPLYKVFCQVTGFGGTTQRVNDLQKKIITPLANGKLIKVDFTANVHSTMPWKFKPSQHSIKVVPGETALAFYTVTNPTDKPITGVATYNVFPPKSGLYFNKIQCFCFEEQRLGPHEEVDMPVFFFLDPDLIDDPAMNNVTNITLSYTFFKTDSDEGVVENAVQINGAVVSK